MHTSSFLFSGLFFLLFSPMLVIGMDTTTSGRILDAFKKEEYAILFENVPFDQTGSSDIYRQEYILSGIEGLKNRLESVKKVYQSKKETTTEKRQTLEQTIAGINQSIAHTTLDIRKSELAMKEKNVRIDEYRDMSIALALRIQRNKSVILGYIANIYSESNLIFDENNGVDIFQTLIMTTESTDAVGKDIVYKSLISILGQQFIEDYRTLIREYHKIQSNIREQLALLEIDKNLLDRQKANLISQRSYKDMLLESTKGEEALYERYIDDQTRSQERLEAEWQKATEAYTVSLEKLLAQNGCQTERKTGKDIEKCANILAFYRNERALKKINIDTSSGNVFSWPITPKRLSTYFRDASYYRFTGSQHDAIDIPSPQGTDILAPMDGYVQYILPPVSGGYSYMAIKHPGGYVTLYGHLSEVLVFPYQFVRKGDRIARSGGAPGTPGAGPMTTGAHLHFEVWKNRVAIDPLRLLDISVLDYSELPPRYQDKYIVDIVSRVGTGADLSDYDRTFVIRGETEEARQKYLLRTYATRDFQSWDTWYDTAMDARIDPSFLICVGLAETTLGNHLKTPYNIGNVGNTDSGDTASFSSPREGIAWMASTFNNRYLSHYNHVSDLSRWGNPVGTIYASSNANWHNNIIRCVSSLKGRFVDDDYLFRVTE